eukprot:359602-Chlamydomonas_euryale.AAC.4
MAAARQAQWQPAHGQAAEPPCLSHLVVTMAGQLRATAMRSAVESHDSQGRRHDVSMTSTLIAWPYNAS